MVSLAACAPTGLLGSASRAEPLRPVAERHALDVERLLAQEGATRAMEHVEHLALGIGPRLASSRNYTRAARWAVECFRDFGLAARLERFADFPVGFDRGQSSGRVVAPRARELVFATPPWTPGTDGLQRGPVVLAPTSLSELGERGDELRSAWVLEPPDGEGRRAAGRERMREAIAPLGPLGFLRDGGEPMKVLGPPPLRWKERARQVDVALRRDHYRELLDEVEAGAAPVVELDVDNRLRRGPIAQHNVVADLVGVELPDELVIVGAHLDSWDLASGACDNATGVATTMEAARLLATIGARPRRTIRFVLFGAEEQGLLGSEGYVRGHREELERTSAVLVHDRGTNYLSGLPSNAAVRDDLVRATAPVRRLAREGMPFRVGRPTGLAPGKAASDHRSFLAAGVPAFFWKQSGRADYERVHHSQYDHLDQVIGEYVEHSSLVVAITALGLANLEHRLDRTGLGRE